MALMFSILVFVLVVAAIVDIVTRDDGHVKYMPKIAWLLLVVFLPLIGAVLWFVLGREYGGEMFGDQVRRRVPQQRRPEPPRAAPSPRPFVDTRSTEEQLRDVEREIEEYRALAELQRRRREQEQRRELEP